MQAKHWKNGGGSGVYSWDMVGDAEEQWLALKAAAQAERRAAELEDEDAYQEHEARQWLQATLEGLLEELLSEKTHQEVRQHIDHQLLEEHTLAPAEEHYLKVFTEEGLWRDAPSLGAPPPEDREDLTTGLWSEAEEEDELPDFGEA